MDKIISYVERHSRLLTTAFFLAILLVGWAIHGSYGVHWDESENQGFGYRSVNTIAFYVFNKAPDHNGVLGPAAHDWYHGGFFETILAWLTQSAFRLQDSRDIILMRHMACFVSYWLGLLAFYAVCRMHFKQRGLALLGLTFFVLTPSIFSHAFYNTVDIAFMAAFTASALTLILLLKHMTLRHVLLHALVCASCFNIRFQGAGMALLTVLMMIKTSMGGGRQPSRRSRAALTVLFVLSFVVLTYAFMPLLWGDSLTQIRYLIQRLTESHWQQTILYLGEYTSGPQQPWHYPLVWIAISTPLLYVALTLVGLADYLSRLWMKERYAGEKDHIIIFLFWFLVPLLIVVTQAKAFLYDGWRHLFFIYPAMLLFVLAGWRVVWNAAAAKGKAAQRILSGVLVLNLLWTAHFMITSHPYQHLYFNSLAGSDMAQVAKRFEMDYWGLSYREGLEYILAHDKRDGIRIQAENVPCYYNIGILPQDQRRRLGSTDKNEEADYFLTNYRWHNQPYPFNNEVYSVKMGNAKVMTVYRMKGQ